MKYSKWIGLMGVIGLIITCFIPWVYIQSKNITVSGFKADGTHFGKPGLLHLLLSIFILTAFVLSKIWAKRVNVFLCAMNLAFAIRNYILITGCLAGECPEKKLGIFLVLSSSTIMMIAALFPDVVINQKKK